MKIKTFKARTFSEALDLVKKEMSTDAVILSTEERKGLRPYVEVTAAVDYDLASNRINPSGTQAAAEKTRFSVMPDGSRPHMQNHEFKTQESKPNAALNSLYSEAAATQNSIEQMRNELSSLRKAIETMRNNGYEMVLPPHKRKVYTLLRKRSVREEYALRICERVKTLEDLPNIISSDIVVKNRHQTKKAIMFVGPTGAGKTTTIAKLAAHAVKANKRAAIINLDTYRIGAVEQIRIYSRILGIPMAIATNGVELRNCLVKFAEQKDVIFIDTTGRNPRDERAIADLAELCNVTEVPLDIHLLMSANTDDEFLIEAHRAYSKLPINYIAFSKIDEAVRYGALYNVAITYQKPVSYLTTGQRVPADIEAATAGRLTELIIRQGMC